MLGEHLRRRRIDQGLGLRATARNVGISPTFLSRIETGTEAAVPSEEVIRKLAMVLDEDFDALMRLAGRIPDEIQDFVKTDPRMLEFLRRAKEANISGKELLEMLEQQEHD